MKLRIVITYFNRKELLISTLKSIELSKSRDFEVAIIDDASDENQRVEDSIDNFTYPIKLLRISSTEKTWEEPLDLINKLVKEFSGDFVVHQSAECLHVGDVISRIINEIKPKLHMSFACLGAHPDWCIKIKSLPEFSRRKILSILPAIYFDRDCPKWAETWEPVPGLFWNNHSIVHPSPYPWCMAMTKNDYIEMGGFDVDYAYGYTCADDDFLDRVKLNKIEIKIIDDPFVIHQWHHGFFESKPNRQELWSRNQNLLKEKRAKRNENSRHWI